MDDYYRSGGIGGVGFGGDTTTVGHRYGTHDQQRSHQVVKAVTAVTAGGSLLALSGLTLVGTVIALIIATPLLVIFSPVLVPALITVLMLATGFVASGGFGIAATSVLAWIYRYLTGEHPVGADQLDYAQMKLAGKARDVKDAAREQFGGTQGYGQHGQHGKHTTTHTTQTTT